jgi:hypothetical protein
MLIGTHTFAARGEGARRQDAGVASMRALQRVEVVNVQFASDPHHMPDVETLPVLTRTSNSVSRRSGPMKPIMSDIFDVLAQEASRRGLPYFAFTNADILISQEAVDWMLATKLDTYVFSREDFDGETGQSKGMELAGTDVFVSSTAWWAAHRHRFRPYIAAEGVWDNVYTAIMMVHSNGVIENRRPLVRHESHPPGPMPSPYFGVYTNYLAALDSWYFDRWCKYWDGLLRLRKDHASEDAEQALRRRILTWPPSTFDRLLQEARSLKARVRYGAWKMRHGEIS